MRFLLGVLVGYTVRGKQKLLIRFLVTLALVVYVVVPTVALLALRLDVQRERATIVEETSILLVAYAPSNPSIVSSLELGMG